MSELANNKSIRKEVDDLGETLGIEPKGKNNQQKIRSIGEQASDGTYATKEYVNTLMSGALKRAIVEELPTTDIDTNTIYMVLDSEASQQGNVYNEYLYINNAWELIGTTEVSGAGIEYVYLQEMSGVISDEDYQKLLNGAYIIVSIEPEGEAMYPQSIVCLPNHGYFNLSYTSTVLEDNIYLKVTIDSNPSIEGSYTITEETIGGGSGIEYVELQSEGGTLTQEQITKLENGAWVKNEFGIIFMPSNPMVIYSAPIECDYDAGKGYINQLAIAPFTNNYTFSRYTFNINTAQ